MPGWKGRIGAADPVSVEVVLWELELKFQMPGLEPSTDNTAENAMQRVHWMFVVDKCCDVIMLSISLLTYRTIYIYIPTSYYSALC